MLVAWGRGCRTATGEKRVAEHGVALQRGYESLGGRKHPETLEEMEIARSVGWLVGSQRPHPKTTWLGE